MKVIFICLLTLSINSIFANNASNTKIELRDDSIKINDSSCKTDNDNNLSLASKLQNGNRKQVSKPSSVHKKDECESKSGNSKSN